MLDRHGTQTFIAHDAIEFSNIIFSQFSKSMFTLFICYFNGFIDLSIIYSQNTQREEWAHGSCSTAKLKIKSIDVALTSVQQIAGVNRTKKPKKSENKNNEK